MTDSAPFGLLALIAGLIVAAIRCFKTRNKKRSLTAPESPAAKEAREAIVEQGNREVTETIGDLKAPNALQRLVDRANRQRGRRK